MSSELTGDELPKRQEPLSWAAWWETLGDWRTIRRALKRFDKTTRADLYKSVVQLVNWNVARRSTFGLPDMLNSAIPDLVARLNARDLRCALELALHLADKQIDPHRTLACGLPAVASLTAEQFTAALDLARRLADHGIDPDDTLVYSVPAVAKTSRSLAEFQANLATLESVTIRLQDRGLSARLLETAIPVVTAVSRSTEEYHGNMATLVSVIICLKDKGIPLWGTLVDALPTMAKLSTDQFAAALDVARYLADRSINPGQTLKYGVPGVAKLTAERFAAALDFAHHLADKGIDPGTTLQYGVPAMAELTAEQFSAGLDLAHRLTDKGINPHKTLGWIGRALARLTAEQFAAVLDVTRRLADKSIDPENTLDGVGAVATLTSERFAAAVDLARQLADKGMDPSKMLRIGISAVAKLEAKQFAAGLDLARRLAERGIDPCDTLKYGVPAVAKNCCLPAEVQAANELLRKLGSIRELDWSAISECEWTAILHAVFNYHRQGLGYHVYVETEAYHVQYWEETYLDRQGNTSEVNYWVFQFTKNHQTSENLAAQFVSSLEYFLSSANGQGDRATWVRAVYHDVLHREASDAEVMGWVG